MERAESIARAENATWIQMRRRWARSSGGNPLLWVALATCGLVLALHIATYWFLTDDAFISFRYARNLAAGNGLVYNPGSEPVEGYTNFLWVVVLAALARIGARPEIVALWLSVAATAALWIMALLAGRRLLAPSVSSRLLLLAPLALALNRSFAMWSTGGLETRFFELLLFAGLFRVYAEGRDRLLSKRRSLPVGAFLLSLAALTRLDGLLIAGGSSGARPRFAQGSPPRCSR